MWLGLLLLGFSCGCALGHDDFGPWVEPTKGEVFPRVAIRSKSPDFLIVRPLAFQFNATGQSCDVLKDAMDRYQSILLNEARVALKTALPIPRTYVQQSPLLRGELVTMNINLRNPCEPYPHFQMNESYILSINEDTSAYLGADEIWGILRGLETFSQLLTASSDGHLTIKCQRILDSPRFPHRGLLLDTSRHYLPVSDILLTLDAMSYNKLNVFHWHIVDDNSFPYVSTSFPKLSESGAYHRTMVYTQSNVRRIIEYARLRGIRVVPEFDSPGHSKSWGNSYPEILTTCYANGKPNGKLGPMNPLDDSPTWPMMVTLLTELFAVFPDRYFHFGGDEVNFDCWASNPEIIEFMHKKGYQSDFKRLERHYFERLLTVPREFNVTSIVWQEVYQNNPKLQKHDMVVHVWTGAWQALMQDLISKNYSTLLSACWYLDDVKSGGDWLKYYLCDPSDLIATPDELSRVLGGEACMWGEFVDRTNVHSRIWPRASAAAERLWSWGMDDLDFVAQRLEEHSCRMNRRGIPAQPPNGPGFCVV
ncbi:beta-hexosaminidase subunit alpha-like [Venturia canescens]|uniref:beta-hexosaminidase subunit alpha-like n=1 Tax=Venturia canescens TaxID=32260 RepID=UPI001C9C0A22|nr:beta-hexosaminidase subunit alpha-like [Venturia canescens]